MPPVHTSMLAGRFQRADVPQINPGWQQAEAAFEQHARRTGIITTETDATMMLSFAFGRFTGWCYPLMAQQELDLLTQWHYWLTLSDDVADAITDPHLASDLRDGILRVLTDPAPPACRDPIVVSVHDLWWRTATPQNDQWRDRARADLAIYLAHWVAQCDNRAHGRIMTVTEYVDFRRQTVGLDFNTDVLEALHAIQLPAPLLAASFFRQLRDCFVDANAWFNDYYSYEREAASGEDHNLAIVIAHDHGSLPRQALNRVLEMIDERLQAFLRIEDQLPALVTAMGYPDSTAAALRYAQVLRDYTYGHVAWSSTSTRYNDQRLRATRWGYHNENPRPGTCIGL